METYVADERAEKVNLSIGLYYDQDGKIPTLDAVALAQHQVNTAEQAPCVYLPMEGLKEYRTAVQRLVFGEQHPALDAGRIATIQTLGGSGALMIGADFLHRYFPQSRVWVSNPTWENHNAIFEGAGFTVGAYPYFDPATKSLDFVGMMTCLRALPAGEIVLLHPCCHNPTGVDLTNEQWDEVIDVVSRNQLIPFFDMAYQGFGRSIDDDAYVIRQLALSETVTFLVSNSFSKIFSLYGERVGGLSIVCPNSSIATNILGQLKATVRRNYSSPAKYGAVLVSKVLGAPDLNTQWLDEVDAMRSRISSMREALFARLNELVPEKDFSFIVQQKGMFSYTGFSVAQVEELRNVHAIYLLSSGRMCLAGLNQYNMEKVAQAFAAL
jgi:aromatic-amino-acid transaminase